MKKIIYYCLLLLMFADCSLLTPKSSRKVASSDKPFNTALVISGENLNTPYFIGMIDGLTAKNKKPDVIVASCGASIAAAIYKAIPDEKERLKFLQSPEYYNTLKNLQMDDPSLLTFAKMLYAQKKFASKQEQISSTQQRYIPDPFSYSLLNVGKSVINDPEANLDQKFSSENTRIVIVAARVDYNPSESGKFISADRKLFTETYFTDPDTASFLNNLPSFAGTVVPTSSVASETNTITEATLGEAVRASITDPILVNPMQYDGHYYLTGAVNIDPINVAQQLATEVIARYRGSYDHLIEVPALMATFAFEGNEVAKKAYSSKIDYFIDGSEEFPNFSLGPVPNIWGAIKSFNLARTYKFGSRLPTTHEEFIKLAMKQYQFGFQKAQESLEFSKEDKTHIKKSLK